MTKQLSSETVDTVDNGTKTSVENVVENAAKSKVETGTNKHERNRRRSSDFDEEDWQKKGKVIDEVKICSYENNYKEGLFCQTNRHLHINGQTYILVQNAENGG